MMPTRHPLSLGIYRALSHVAGPATDLLLARRVKQQKEDPDRLGERRGHASIERPEGRLIWLHAASVGEITTALPLVRRLQARGDNVLITTVTWTAAKWAAGHLPEGAIHQFVPIDLPSSVERFLTFWQPSLALFMEQEIWPNLLACCHAQGIPTLLVNARMSPRSFKRWTMAKDAARHLLSHFDLVLGQSMADSERLAKLGATRVLNVGNIKLDTPILHADPQQVIDLAHGLSGRAVWTAASTHQGEDELVLDAHAIARQGISQSLALILAPRHPKRVDEVEALCTLRGFSTVRRSSGQWPDANTDIFLIDTIGELGLAFRVGQLAFLGGSFQPKIGGHNPIEPAKLSRLVLHGPYGHNFSEVFRTLDEAGGGIAVADAAALGAALCHYLTQAEERDKRAELGRTAIEGLSGVIDRVFTALEPYLNQSKLDPQR